jgi:FkbM family methyltransferase
MGTAPTPQKWRGLLTSIPRFRGEMRLVNSFAALTSYVRGKERSVELWNSSPFHVDLSDRIQRQMWLGCYEPHVNRAIAALLQPGSVFLDVGANIGYHSYFAAGLVGFSGAVFSFEPDPGVYARLVRNLSSFSWAHAENAAVWHTGAQLEFDRSFADGESGWGVLTAVRDCNRGQRISVRALAIDEWNAPGKLPSLDLVKADVEGAELHMLHGAQSTLQKFAPDILLEVSAPLLIEGGSSAAELIAELEHFDYSVFTLEDSRISPYEPIPDYHAVDCLCIKRERSSETLDKLRRRGFHS